MSRTWRSHVAHVKDVDGVRIACRQGVMCWHIRVWLRHVTHIHMCDTYSYVWHVVFIWTHDSLSHDIHIFTCVTCVRHEKSCVDIFTCVTCVRHEESWVHLKRTCHTYECGVCVCAMWQVMCAYENVVCVCHVTGSHVSIWIRKFTHMNMCHTSEYVSHVVFISGFICVTCLIRIWIHMCDMSDSYLDSYVWHGWFVSGFICVTCLIHVWRLCDMTCLIHMRNVCDVSYSYVGALQCVAVCCSASQSSAKPTCLIHMRNVCDVSYSYVEMNVCDVSYSYVEMNMWMRMCDMSYSYEEYVWQVCFICWFIGGDFHMNETFICTRHGTHMNKSCRTLEWVMLHIWTSHVARMNESRCTYERVTSRIMW